MKERLLHSCKDLLKKVSRSFALTIPMLDDELYPAIMVSYLQYRLLDNFEDEVKNVPPVSRRQMMDKVVHAFDPDNSRPQSDINSIKNNADLIADPDLRELTLKAGLLRKAGESLEKRVQKYSFYWMQEMNTGMKKYLTKTITDFSELDEYCYYVAGTVGGFLTDTIILKAGLKSSDSEILKDNFYDSGLFLQKVNLIRDIKIDIKQRRKNFWPLPALDISKDQLLKEQYQEQSLKALSQMLSDAGRHIPGLKNYMEALPDDYPGYRKFFAVNNALGLATIEKLRNNPDVFYGDRVKVPKTTLLKILNSPEEIFWDKAEKVYNSLS